MYPGALWSMDVLLKSIFCLVSSLVCHHSLLWLPQSSVPYTFYRWFCQCRQTYALPCLYGILHIPITFRPSLFFIALSGLVIRSTGHLNIQLMTTQITITQRLAFSVSLHCTAFSGFQQCHPCRLATISHRPSTFEFEFPIEPGIKCF
jgi:hypothetical protein